MTIGNRGDVRGRFDVTATGVQETAGVHGGLPSGRVQLLLVDETDPQHPVTVYAGTPAGLGEVDLGSFGAGEERDYRLQVTLPDGGRSASDTTGDNRFQGASLSLALEWRAAPVAAATPPPTPTPTPAPAAPTATPAPAPKTPLVPAGALGMPAASTCVKGGTLTLRLRSPNGTSVLSATVTVNGLVKARVKGARARRPVSLNGLGKKPATVTVTVEASDRRSYRATRSYRPCARR